MAIGRDRLPCQRYHPTKLPEEEKDRRLNSCPVPTIDSKAVLHVLPAVRIFSYDYHQRSGYLMTTIYNLMKDSYTNHTSEYYRFSRLLIRAFFTFLK